MLIIEVEIRSLTYVYNWYKNSQYFDGNETFVYKLIKDHQQNDKLISNGLQN